mgnify:CR=1 FL=1
MANFYSKFHFGWKLLDFAKASFHKKWKRLGHRMTLR